MVVVRTTAAAAGTRIVTSTAATSTAAGTTITRPRPPRPVTGEMTAVIRIFGSAVATTAVLLIGDTMPHGQGEEDQWPLGDRIIIRGTMEVQR